MAYQLIYTSVRRGLIPGRSGYTVAARHRQIRERLVTEIERISGYTFAKSGVSPVVHAHRLLSVSGVDYHILTRIVDAGSDYTGRTNHLAHHVICEASEIEGCRASPADVLHGFEWCDRYEEEPRHFDDNEVVDLEKYANAFALPAKSWAELRGEAADAALLIDDNGRPASAFIVAPSAEDAAERQTLALFGESQRLLVPGGAGGASPWDVFFTTFLQQADSLADFDWVGCTSDHPILQRPGRRRVLDLSDLREPTPQSDAAKHAATGRALPQTKKPIAPPPPDTAREPAAPSIDPQAAASDSAKTEQKEVAASASHASRSTRMVSGASAPKLAPAAPKAILEAKPSYFAEHLKLIIAGAGSFVMLIVLLLIYTMGVRPWQVLKSDVSAHLGQREFEKADALLDRSAEGNPRWQGRIDEFRRSTFLDEMVVATEEEIDAFAAATDVETAGALGTSASRRLKMLKSFARVYNATDADQAIDNLSQELERWESRHATRIKMAMALPPPRPPRPPDSRPVIAVPAGTPKVAPTGTPSVKPVDPGTLPEAAFPAPKSLYVFLNAGLDSLILQESMPKLAHGEQGARRVAIKTVTLKRDRFPPDLAQGARSFAYKFPETADEEGDRLLPIGGGLNVELKFQGGVSLQLLKTESAGGGRGIDVWSTAPSKLLEFGEAADGVQVLLWSGRPLSSDVALFKPSKQTAAASPRFAQFITALKVGQPAQATPREILFRFHPPATHSEPPRSLESARLELPHDDAAKLYIDFGSSTAQRAEAVAKFEEQIDKRERLIDSAREYMQWKDNYESLEAGLRATATDLLGPGHDVLIRYRTVLDHADPKRVREELHGFTVALLLHFDETLKDLDIDREDIPKIKSVVSSLNFLDEWGRHEVETETAAGYAEFMESFADECRDLAKKRAKRSRSNGDVVSYDWIESRDAKEALNDFADLWQAQFAGESGERLWEFASLRRPPIPRNLKQAMQAQKELPALMSRKVEAQRALAAFAPLGEDGLPPGRYEACLVFEDGEPIPFITSEIARRRSEK